MSTRTRLGLLVLAGTVTACGTGDSSAVSAPMDTGVENTGADDAERLNAYAEVQFGAPNMASSRAFVLSDEKQKYLRDTELLVLVLGQDVWPRFQTALMGGSAEPLLELFAEDFEASVFGGEGTAVRQGPVTVRSWSESDRLTVGGAGLAREFAAYNDRFEKLESAKYHVTQLSPQKHGDLSGAWDVRWDMHLKGELPNGDRAEYTFVCELQFDRFNEEILSGDEPETGWILDLNIADATFIHAPALMREITQTSGIDVSVFDDNWNRTGPPYFPITGGAHLLDFDRDGRVDLLMTGEKQPYLYRGLGHGEFEDVSKVSGLANGPKRTIQAALVADFDNDGYEDILLMILGRKKLDDGRVIPKLRYELYANNGIDGSDGSRASGTFRRVSDFDHNLHRFRYEAGFIGVAIADYDADGLIDIYVGKGGKLAPKGQRREQWLDDQSSPEGLLLRNTGNWQFVDATAEAGMTGKHIDTFGAIWLDVEPDGDPDLFLANHMGPNVLWLNQGDGTFRSAPIDEGFGGFSMGAAAGDLDGDGDPDLYIANMYSSAGSRILDNLRPEDYPDGAFANIQGFVAGNKLYDNGGGGELIPLGVEAGVDNAGWAYGPGLVDLDGDGQLDIYAPAGFQSVTRDKPDT